MEEIVPITSKDDAILYFKDLFDKVLEHDPESQESFKQRVLKHGTRTVLNLTTLLKYPQAKRIHEKAFRVCILALFEASRDKSPVELLYGCRNPLSKGEGYWDGAFIVAKGRNEQLKTFLFQDGFDAVEEPLDAVNAYKQYEKHIKEGWTPMTLDDLTRTTGMNIDNKTRLSPPTKLSNGGIRRLLIKEGVVLGMTVGLLFVVKKLIR